MSDYIFLMHGADVKTTPDAWNTYIASLIDKGVMRGGSAIGRGGCFNRSGEAPGITAHITGYIKVETESLEAACVLLDGNPVYEAGGTVEVRELPVTD